MGILGGIGKGVKSIFVGKGGHYTSTGHKTYGGILGGIDQIFDPIKEVDSLRATLEGAEEISKNTWNTLTRKAKNKDSIVANLTGRELRPTVAITAGVLMAGGAVGNESFKTYNKIKFGTNIGVINTPGDMSEVQTPDMSEFEKQTGLYDNMKNGTLSNYGATGDIVFALNNQR